MNQPSEPTTANVSRQDQWVERVFFLFLTGIGLSVCFLSSLTRIYGDELYSYFTDRAPSVMDVIRIQTTSPVSLDPPFHHILENLLIHAGFTGFFMYRLPSMLGALLAIICVYFFARRLMGVWGAILSASILLLDLLIRFVYLFVNDRPYGLLLGASGFALLMWQNCLENTRRAYSLLGLFLAFEVAIGSHYYGILVPLPFLFAEFYRLIARRKIDFFLTATILASYILVIIDLPALKAAKTYGSHYYVRAALLQSLYASYFAPYYSRLQSLVHGHLWVLMNRVFCPLALLAFLIVVLSGAYLGIQKSKASISHRAEWVAVTLFALLPLLGYLVSRLNSGVIEPRHTAEYILGIAIAIASTVLRVLPSRAIRLGIFLALCIVMTAVIAARITPILLADAAHRPENLSQLAERTEIVRQVQQLSALSRSSSDVPIVIENPELFLDMNYFQPEILTSIPRLTYVYDISRSISLAGTDTDDRTMMNFRRFTNLPVTSYTEFAGGIQQKAFLVTNMYTTPWLPKQLRADGYSVRQIDIVGDESIYEVSPPKSSNPAK